MLKFKEGETYICAESCHPWWTGGKEYSVISNTNNRPTIQDDSGTSWYDYEVNIMGYDFKLKAENEMTILKRYKCIKSNNKKAFAVGEIYPLYKGDRNYIVSNGNVKWYENEFSFIKAQMGVELKEENKMLNVKEGQTYVCKRDDLDEWTFDKEYGVQKFSNGRLYIMDDNTDGWYLPNDKLMNEVFKLKENKLDLNKLTAAELREYVELLENKEKSEILLNEFIERMTK